MIFYSSFNLKYITNMLDIDKGFNYVLCFIFWINKNIPEIHILNIL